MCYKRESPIYSAHVVITGNRGNQPRSQQKHGTNSLYRETPNNIFIRKNSFINHLHT